MKKIIKFCLIIIIMMMSVVSANAVAAIGNKPSTTSSTLYNVEICSPKYIYAGFPFYDYSSRLSEIVYTTSLMSVINAGDLIYGIRYIAQAQDNVFGESCSVKCRVNVWVANGDDPSELKDFTDLSLMTQVCAEEKIGIKDSYKEVDIDFSSPFQYEGKALYVIIECTEIEDEDVVVDFQMCDLEEGFFCINGVPNVPITIYSNQYLPATSLLIAKNLSPDDPEPRTISVTIPAVSDATHGYTTFFNSEYAVKLPDGVSASTYRYNSDTETLEVEAVENIVPASCGVVLYTENPGDYTLTEATASVEGFPSNDMRGSDAEAVTEGDEGDVFYEFTDKSEGAGFYYGAEGGAAFMNPAHKAYLALDAETGVKYYGFTAEGKGLTGIKGINAESTEPLRIFNISGQKINNATEPGFYIIDGRKIIVK